MHVLRDFHITDDVHCLHVVHACACTAFLLANALFYFFLVMPLHFAVYSFLLLLKFAFHFSTWEHLLIDEQPAMSRSVSFLLQSKIGRKKKKHFLKNFVFSITYFSLGQFSNNCEPPHTKPAWRQYYLIKMGLNKKKKSSAQIEIRPFWNEGKRVKALPLNHTWDSGSNAHRPLGSCGKSKWIRVKRNDGKNSLPREWPPGGMSAASGNCLPEHIVTIKPIYYNRPFKWMFQQIS